MSAMGAKATVVHQLPGRVRLQIPARLGDVAYFRELVASLSGLADLTKVKTNPLAASVTLEFAGAAAELLRQVSQRAALELHPTAATSTLIAARHQPGKSRAPLRLVSGRDIDPLFMIGSAYLALGTFQTLRGKVLVPALSFFWYAFDIFRRANQED